MIFRLLAGHGSLSEQESEAMVEAVFGGIKQPGYRCHRKIKEKHRTPNAPNNS
jgi:hypothetical protein